MEQEITPEELRNTAHFVEEEILDTLADLSDVTFPLVVGGAKDFPRPAPEGRAVDQGVDVLREEAEDAVAALHALATALENELPVPPALRASVDPFIDAFRRAEGQPPSENGPNQTEGDTAT
jgi:hypothetical protein